MKTLSLIMATSLFAVASQAQTFTASLSGANERPTANTSAATGVASISIVGDLLSYSVSYTGLIPTAAHLHGAAGVDANAGVMVPFTLTSSAGNSGLFSGTATLTDSQKNTILAGTSYANIHSAAFPGGEIRGQVVAVPEPGTVALRGLGAAALALRMRKKA